jgi:hypothetical protein
MPLAQMARIVQPKGQKFRAALQGRFHRSQESREADGAGSAAKLLTKFMEAAKEGEYQHNLEILAAFLTAEMKQ